MGPKISRKWARIALSLAVSSLAVLVLLLVLAALLDLGPADVGIAVGAVLLALLLMALAVAALFRLRCPGCGRQTVRPQWGPGRRLYCPLCGAPLVYDDEGGRSGGAPGFGTDGGE